MPLRAVHVNHFVLKGVSMKAETGHPVVDSKASINKIMAAKITAFLLTIILNLAAGVFIFFIMLLAMNGFHESDAMWGLGVYIVLGVTVSILMASAAAYLVHILVKKQFSPWVSALIAVPVFSIVGGGLKIVLSVVGVLIADYVRVNH